MERKSLKNYTVRGEEFQKGFENLVMDFMMNATEDCTVYLDTENNNIDAIPTREYTDLPDTRCDINQAIWEWKVDTPRPRAVYYFSFRDLEKECMNKDEVRALRRQFEKENRFNNDVFYEGDFDNNYTDFLLHAGNKDIDNYVEWCFENIIRTYKNDLNKRLKEMLEKELIE